MSSIALSVTFTCLPEHRAAIVSALVQHRVRSLQTEPGTLQFEIMTPDDKADSIILFELYASQQAMETHMEGSSLAQFRAETEGQILTINVETCSHHR